MPTHYCFCTLAVGKRYRLHAKMLAEDLQKNAPDIPLILLTDSPSDFKHLCNVKAYPHRLQSVKGYHDKRFVIEKALESFDHCLFVDADIRVLGPIPESIHFPAGLVARYGCGIIKHNTEGKIRPAFDPIQAVAEALQLNLKKVFWFHEFMFLFSKQQGKEKAFFSYWQSIALYFEQQGIYDGEGNVMGLAAAASGLDIHFHRSDFFPCFKDNIQKEKIKQGQADPKAMANEFKIHSAIEYPQRSSLQKVSDKCQAKTSFYRRLISLKVKTQQASLPSMLKTNYVKE